MTMDRLSDRVCDMTADALTRMLAFGEELDSIDFSLTLLPTPTGMVAVGLVYVAIKGPLLGTVLGNVAIVSDLSLLSAQHGIDESVRSSLDSIRSQKAAILAAANGSEGA